MLPSKQGYDEVKMDSNSDELSVDERNVDPAVRYHPSIGVGNTRQIALNLFVEDVGLDETFTHCITENVSRPLDWIPGDLMAVLSHLVESLQLLLLLPCHQAGFDEVIVGWEPAGHLTGDPSEAQYAGQVCQPDYRFSCLRGLNWIFLRFTSYQQE